MDSQNSFPYTFNKNICKTCDGKCCRGFAGYVWISENELEKIAGTRKMEVASFSKQYVRKVQGRFALQERVINGEYFCCFLTPSIVGVQSIKADPSNAELFHSGINSR